MPTTIVHSRRWLGLGVLCFSLLVVMMDMTILNIALPSLISELQPTNEEVLWMVDGYSITLAGLLVTMSALADKYGRKRLIMLGYLGFGLVSLGVIFASSPGAVIALRLLLGVAGAMIMPTTLSVIRVIFTNETELRYALGIWAGMSAVGAAIGPMVAGILLQFFGWHGAFLVNVPFMAMALLLAIWLLPESRITGGKPLDLVAAGMSLGGVSALIWALTRFGEKRSLADLPSWVGVVIGLALIVLFVRRCLRAEKPLIDLRIFKNRGFTAGIVAALISLLAMGASFLLLSQWFLAVAGFTPTITGLFLLFPVALSVVASVAAPWLASKSSNQLVLSLALATSGLGLALLAIYPANLTPTVVIISFSLVCVGLGSLTTASTLIIAHSPARKAGSASALEETAYELGNVIGVAILGSVAGITFANKVHHIGVAFGLPPALSDKAQDSVVTALAQATHSANASAYISAVKSAFSQAMQLAGGGGAAIMIAGAGLVFWLLRRQPTR